MSVYNKLVRDKIPQIIAAGGQSAKIRVLDDQEFREALRTKLQEETGEYLSSGTNDEHALEELADLLEVVHSLALLHGATLEQLEAKRKEKADLRGGFHERVYLLEVIDANLF